MDPERPFTTTSKIFSPTASHWNKYFNQTYFLYQRDLPDRFSHLPVIISNRERSFAGRSPAVISWPGNVELR
jgi:hypothetical protein